ncbi:MAG TPA: ABC transporter permease [Gemmatimonadaceae bacterium]
MIARRIAQSIPLLLLVSLLVFALLHAVPGGPLAIYLENPGVRPEDIERLRRSLGLDQPLPVQYIQWLAGFVRGDWGFSLSDGRPVAERMLERAPATLELAGVSLLVAVIAALPLGIVAAVRRGGWFDRLSSGVALAGVSLPVFWFGLVLQLVVALGLGWLPSSGRSSVFDSGVADRLRHLVLPAIVLAAVHAAGWSRYLRAAMIGILDQRFIQAGAARGVPARALYLRHALRNAAGPLVALIFMDAALLVSGAVVTESVFAWPGLGGLFTEALARRDYPVLMAFLMVTSVAVIVLNLLADLAHRAIDPRVT